jgi:hypothetical protein
LPDIFCWDVFGWGDVMKWAKERDDLIAQTKAFVQSVTGRRTEPAPEPKPLVELNRAEPPRTEDPVVMAQPVPATSSVSFEPVARFAQADILPPEAPAARVLAQSEVRKEIKNRVAAFQAHQHRFHREREAYFKSVLIKVRSAIENGPDAPSA